MTFSLYMADHYLFHPVLSVMCHIFCQLVFLSISLYITPSSLSCSIPASSSTDFLFLRFCTDMISYPRHRPNYFSRLFYGVRVHLFSDVIYIILLKSVEVSKLQVAILARSSWDMSQTVRCLKAHLVTSLRLSSA